MGLFTFLYDRYKLNKEKNFFCNLCNDNNLDIEFICNKSDIHILKEIFHERVYSDYFPFYQNVTVVDIGAHKGYFALFAKNNLKDTSRIIALEPMKKNFEILAKNTLNKNIEIYNEGLYSENIEKDLYINKDENSSLFENYSLLLNLNNSKETEKIKLITLEKLFDEYNIDKIDFLKLDCEGAEYKILFSTNKKILEKIEIISMEFHDLKDEYYNAHNLVSFLEKNNFEIKKYAYEKTVINNNFGKIVAKRVRS
ncbi:MAG: FkbM family methyltransferase [Candidatus Sericytochromatia bacterium]